MKKNLLSIIILFLLIINLSLTGVLVFSLVTANQRATALMADVATVLRLELPTAGAGEFVAPEIPIANVATYNVAAGEAMTMPLKQGPEDASTRYVMVRVSLSMDSKNRGYRDNGEGDLSAVDMMIQDIIITAFGRYTGDEVKEADIQEQIKGEIINGLHAMYNSDFIFGVLFRDIKYA